MEAEGREEFFRRWGKGGRNYRVEFDWQVQVLRWSGVLVGSGSEGSLLPIMVRIAGVWW